MQHSAESSMADVAPEKTGDGVARLNDVRRSVVSARAASHEFRPLTDSEDFHFQSPEHLLAKFRDTLSNTAPLRQGTLASAGNLWTEPHGFLTAILHPLGEIVDPAAGRVAASEGGRP